MFLWKLLVILVVIPAALIGVTALGGPAVGRVVAYGVFPLALTAFAVAAYLREGSRT